MKSLHNYVAEIRKYEDEWKKSNPGVHPVQWSQELAKAVLELVKKESVKEIYVHPAALSGNVDYSYIICLLEESNIIVKLSQR